MAAVKKLGCGSNPFNVCGIDWALTGSSECCTGGGGVPALHGGGQRAGGPVWRAVDAVPALPGLPAPGASAFPLIYLAALLAPGKDTLHAPSCHSCSMRYYDSQRALCSTMERPRDCLAQSDALFCRRMCCARRGTAPSSTAARRCRRTWPRRTVCLAASATTTGDAAAAFGRLCPKNFTMNGR